MESNTDISIPWSGWQIVRELGEGAFGRVYEIEREIAGTKEKAALKIISRPTNWKEITTMVTRSRPFQKNIQIFLENALANIKC